MKLTNVDLITSELYLPDVPKKPSLNGALIVACMFIFVMALTVLLGCCLMRKKIYNRPKADGKRKKKKKDQEIFTEELTETLRKIEETKKQLEMMKQLFDGVFSTKSVVTC